MLEIFILSQLNVFQILTFWAFSNFEVISIFEWALVKYFCKGVGNSHLIAPVLSFLHEWLGLADDFTVVILCVLAELGFFKFNRHSCSFLKMQVNLAILSVESNVYPGTFVIFYRSLHHTSFAVLRPFVCSHMVVGVQRIHQTCKSQSWTSWEQSFSQVLRCLQILKVSHEKFSGCEVLHHFHLLTFVITEHNDFVDLEDCRRLRNLTHQICLELHGLCIVNDRSSRYTADCKSSDCMHVFLLHCLSLLYLF